MYLISSDKKGAGSFHGDGSLSYYQIIDTGFFAEANTMLRKSIFLIIYQAVAGCVLGSSVLKPLVSTSAKLG
jgi:hypothetical protein